MPRIEYKKCRFNDASKLVIRQANQIISEYMAKGFQLTLRQLFYQFVSRNWLRNSQKNYKRLGEIISNARLSGLIDWEAIVDHTRFIRSITHWDNPAQIIGACTHSFHVDMWANQNYRPEVWIEKDALVSVFDRACREFDVPLFSCRGYTSQSGMWQASRRLTSYTNCNQIPVILHFGDHDPSGLDMSRDIRDRLSMFCGIEPLERLALNMDQVEEYTPPPNPAKMTDSRCQWYIEEYDTTDSWELDALSPEVLHGIVKDKINSLINRKKWNEDLEYERQCKAELASISTHHDKVSKYVAKLQEAEQKKKRRKK